MITTNQKKELIDWFFNLQKVFINQLEFIEKEFSPSSQTYSFKKKNWQRNNNSEEGGGTMALMHGNIFEKVGVNVSNVYGTFSKEFAKQIPGANKNLSFWAGGISFVAHPRNPFIPIAHMNTRHIITEFSWFGGGADLTPVFHFDEDTKLFHNTLEKVCNQFDENYYPQFKKWCDDYFYIHHRKEHRGIGGIFFDNLQNNFDQNFTFIKNLGRDFLKVYTDIVNRRIHMPWTKNDERKQLIKRTKYAEFNLVYDRGTQFGFKTGGNTESILMSMPPSASWI